MISSEGIFRTDTLHEGMVLDYSTKFDMSAASLSKPIKTQVVFPVDVEELIHLLQVLHVLTKTFLKKNGYVIQGLQKLVNFCVNNKRLVRISIHVDSKSIAKFISAVDERIYLWLQQCIIRSAVTDTYLCLVYFMLLIQDIQYNCYNYMLPPSVLTVEKIPVFSKSPKKQADVERKNSVLKDWKLRNSENGKQFS